MPTYDPTETNAGGYDPAPIDPVTAELAALCAEIAALVALMQETTNNLNEARKLFNEVTR